MAKNIMDDFIAINDIGVLNISIVENNDPLIDLRDQNIIAYSDESKIFEQKLANEKELVKTLNLDDIIQVKNTIFTMYSLDQEMRHIYLEDLNRVNQETIVKIDEFHTEIIKKILQKYEWITISKFGKETDKQAWLLVQHADNDPFFQAGCLFILSNLIDKGETDKQNYAYLYDRVAVAESRPQRYGTQAKVVGERLELYPFEGETEDLEVRRREMGLSPLKIYLEQMRSALPLHK